MPPLTMRLSATPASAEVRPATVAIMAMNAKLRAAGLTTYILSLVKLEDVPGLKPDNAIFWITPDGTGVMVEHGLRIADGRANAQVRVSIAADRFDEAQRASLAAILEATRPNRETRQPIRRQT